MCLHENGRAHIGDICRKIKYTGRGKNRDTISRYLNEAFENYIITKPRLTLANHEGSTLYAYLLKCPESRTQTYEALMQHPEVLYAALLYGDYHIFFTSRSNTIPLSCLYEMSPIFTPIYTFPDGWNRSERQCLDIITHYTFEDSILPREVFPPLKWDPLDWQIYNACRMDIRFNLRTIAESLNTTYETVRQHFYKNVLPQTIQCVGFFPQGLFNYSVLYFLVKTPHEHSLVSALSKLQTSCVIWPLRNHLVCMLYFQKLDYFLSTIYLLEKKKIFERYYFLFPLEYFERQI